MSDTMASLVVLFDQLKTDEECDAAQGLLVRRRGALLAEQVKQAIDQGYVPGERVEILTWRASTGKPNEKYGVLSAPNEKSFQVRLESGRFDRFAPNEIRLAPKSA